MKRTNGVALQITGQIAVGLNGQVHSKLRIGVTSGNLVKGAGLRIFTLICMIYVVLSS